MDHRDSGLHLIVLALFACASAPEPSPVPHFDEWDRLVSAASRGDVALARIVARDLAGTDDGEGVARLGGALGFLQLATDPEDLPDAVARAASGCGDCHRSRQVPPPPLPDWDHANAGARAAAAVLWSDPTPPIDPDIPWQEGLAAVLARCQDCHGTDAPTDPTGG